MSCEFELFCAEPTYAGTNGKDVWTLRWFCPNCNTYRERTVTIANSNSKKCVDVTA